MRIFKKKNRKNTGAYKQRYCAICYSMVQKMLQQRPQMPQTNFIKTEFKLTSTPARVSSNSENISFYALGQVMPICL